MQEDEDAETKHEVHGTMLTGMVFCSIGAHGPLSYAGTPVTVESFNAWRARFDAEMRGSQKASLKDEATSKLTGTLPLLERNRYVLDRKA